MIFQKYYDNNWCRVYLQLDDKKITNWQLQLEAQNNILIFSAY